MFSGFNLKIDRNFFGSNFQGYKEIGEKHLARNEFDFKTDMLTYIDSDILNGNEIQNDWFAEIEADVFISHSHKDLDLANAFAGWLNDTFKLQVFIDSNVWGYSEELLNILNDKYSEKCVLGKGIFYDYKKCNTAAQHVYMMLSVALQKMIDKVECVVLLNTDNSIAVFDKNNDEFNRTYSPWIYYEIMLSQTIRRKPLLLYRNYGVLTHANESAYDEKELFELTVAYNISLDHLIEIDINLLHEWEYNYNDCINNEYALDVLYYLHTLKNS